MTSTSDVTLISLTTSRSYCRFPRRPILDHPFRPAGTPASRRHKDPPYREPKFRSTVDRISDEKFSIRIVRILTRSIR